MKQLGKTPAGRYWKRIGIRNHHGFVIPLFSLRSTPASGIGEYPDLIPVMEWMNRLGYDTIQLLPLNDTGNNPSPYSAITAFGLNPIHLGLSQLPAAGRPPEFEPSNRIQFRSLFKKREEFLRDWYKREGIKYADTEEFRAFQADHPWLKGFAVFKTLKEKYDWAPHDTWKEKPDIEKLAKKYAAEVGYHSVIQFFCFKQMHAVKERAEELGMHLLGDIPILLGRESADLWANTRLFRPEFNAGVPPDMFAKDGQNWELPIYDWKQMKKERYAWWKLRLKTAALLYDIYRIDHILGLYRIWAIPKELRGRKGFYTPEKPKEWIKQGEEILNMMIDQGEMFPVGEDLGFIPEEVDKSLRRLGIPGWKVVRWQRKFITGGDFISPKTFPPDSVTCFSTHDTTSMGQWWEQETDDAKAFAAFMKIPYRRPLSQKNRLAILRLCHKSGSLFHINMLQDYLSLIPDFTYANVEDERVNMPSTVNTYNWSIRFVPTIEEMTSNKTLNRLLKEIIA